MVIICYIIVACKTKLGNRIRALRTKCGISQEELAFRTGLHRTYIGSAERGERNVSVINIVAIAKALNVPISKLFSEIEYIIKNEKEIQQR